MSNWNGFGGLDLSGVEAESGRKTLAPGSYTCVMREAKVEAAKGGTGQYLYVELHDVNGGGAVIDRITLANKNADAVRIGLQRLKALLESARHPNPNKPGDVKSLNGLKVGVHVEEGEPWQDTKTGEMRKGGGRPRKYGAYFTPEGADTATAAVKGGTDAYGFDTTIPF